MFDLPLFPLHTVLFPGMPLHLHIFEERYKRMLNRCIQERRPFGVVLIRSGQEALGDLAEPFQVGCTAQLLHVQRLEQGRMTLAAVGQERFRIYTLDRVSEPYLMGQVELIPLSMRTSPALVQDGERLRRQVERYIQLLLTTSGAQDGLTIHGETFALHEFPQHPVELAYAAAGMLQIAPIQKQALLEQDHADILLADMQIIYARELALLKAMLAHGDASGSVDRSQERGISFSRN